MDYKVVDLRQKHLVAWQKHIKRLQPEEWEERGELPLIVYIDVFVKACIMAEMVEGVTVEDVDNMTYAEAYNLYDVLSTEMNERTALEKN